MEFLTRPHFSRIELLGISAGATLLSTGHIGYAAIAIMVTFVLQISLEP